MSHTCELIDPFPNLQLVIIGNFIMCLNPSDLIQGDSDIRYVGLSFVPKNKVKSGFQKHPEYDQQSSAQL